MPLFGDMMLTSQTIDLTPEIKESRVYQEERLQGYVNLFNVIKTSYKKEEPLKENLIVG